MDEPETPKGSPPGDAAAGATAPGAGGAGGGSAAKPAPVKPPPVRPAPARPAPVGSAPEGVASPKSAPPSAAGAPASRASTDASRRKQEDPEDQRTPTDEIESKGIPAATPAPGGGPAALRPAGGPPAAKPAGLPIVQRPPAPAAPPPEPPVEVSGPLDALWWGLRSAWACRGPILFLLAVNLLVAGIVVYPLHGAMDASLSRHPDAVRIGRDLDFRWWIDWTTTQSSLVGAAIDQLGAAALTMVLLGAFFAGGLLEALRHGPRHPVTCEPMPDPLYGGAVPEWRSAAPGPASIRVFLRNSAGHFPRFLVFLAISLPVYWAVHRLLNVWAPIALNDLLESIEDERVGLVLTILRAVAFVSTFHAVTVIFEYVRVAEVLKPGATLLDLLALPGALLRRRAATLIGIEAGAVVLQAAAMLAFIPVIRLLDRSSVAAATLGLVAMQAFLFARMWIRAAAQAAQLRLGQARRARAVRDA